MKRFLSAVFVIVLMLSLVCCDSGNEVSEETSADESAHDEFVMSPDVALINSYLAEEPDRSLKANNIFLGKSYTYNEEPNEEYSDPDCKKLTDGTVRNLFDKFNWVGFNKGSRNVVTFDLGEKKHAVSDIVIGCLQVKDYAISLPQTVKLSASNDGENYTDISVLNTWDSYPDSCKIYLRFSLPKTLNARYVRLSFRRANAFFFMDEIFGFEFSENGRLDVMNGEFLSGDNADYYKYHLSEQILVPVSENDDDYKKYQNLARLDGVDLQMIHFDPMDSGTCSSNTPALAAKEKFFNGKYGTDFYTDPEYVKFNRGEGRHLVVDLGNSMSVSEVKSDFLNQTNVGISVPPTVSVSVSNNGQDWISVYGENSQMYGSDEQKVWKLNAKLKKPVICRYVRLSFATVPMNSIAPNVYMSEIEVWGSKGKSNASEPVFDSEVIFGNYPDINTISCNSIILSMVGNYGQPLGELKKQHAKEYLSHIDSDGNIKDYFADSILISRNNKYSAGSDMKTYAETFIEDVFRDDANFSAVDSAMGEINSVLKEGRKATVWFAMCCPSSGDYCSDIDGDDKNEDFSNYKDRVKYLNWQIDTVSEKFKEKNYKNIVLSGFYWTDEYISEDEFELSCKTISEMNRHIHKQGYKSFWCPYYGAHGIWKWNDVGFDFACLQPNYMFYATSPSRLETTARLAKIYGMGVEIEIEDGESEKGCEMYFQYLNEGVKSGYSKAPKMFYHGGVPGVLNSACNSKDEISRSVYDRSYEYVSGKLEPDFNRPVPVDMSEFTDAEYEVKNGSKIRFEIGDVSNLKLDVVKSPIYGELTLSPDGKMIYKAMRKYRGQDNISFMITDKTVNKKIFNIVINVTEK